MYNAAMPDGEQLTEFVHWSRKKITGDEKGEAHIFLDRLFQDFGILQSGLHWLWFTTKCSELKSDFRYTPESVFDTFPWPQFLKRVAANVRRLQFLPLPSALIKAS